jgi:hypothetical protein
MTPLETICRAMRDSEPGMEGKHWRYWLPSARAALIALAECELPESVIKSGSQAIDWGGELCEDAETLFRAMLHAILATEPGQ